jgi:hypothetical protein
MKPLLLLVTSDPPLAQRRMQRLNGGYNITLSTPEEGMFRMLEVQYSLIVVCSSVARRKLQPFLNFVNKAFSHVPIILLRTGRERSAFHAGTVVRDGDDAMLSALIERALLRHDPNQAASA